MVSGEETKSIRRFVCDQLRDDPDLSTLTIGILKKRYLALVRCESLSPEAKTFMKQVVEEELMKMQEDDENVGELETKKIQNKRKREKESDEEIKGGDDEEESKPKKSRHQSGSSSESEDKEDGETGSDDSELDEQMKSGSQDEKQKVTSKQKEKRKQQISSEDSSEEETDGLEKKGNEKTCDGSPKETAEKEGEKTPQKDEESDSDNKSENSEKSSSSDSSDEGDKEKKVLTDNKTNNEADSDPSSSEDSGAENTEKDEKKEKTNKEKSTKSKSDGGRAVVRLKRYIALCGVRRNYTKLLDGCRSIRSQVAVLKKELEDLGVHGNPSIKKCKKVRLQREEAAELAGLDVGNIITSQGRPKRRGASSWQGQQEPPSSTYVRALDSGSDSDQENKIHRGHRRATDWSNLQGIISDDADSG